MPYLPFEKTKKQKNSMLFCIKVSSFFWFGFVFEDLATRKELLVYIMVAEINKMPDFRDEFEFHILCS